MKTVPQQGEKWTDEQVVDFFLYAHRQINFYDYDEAKRRETVRHEMSEWRHINTPKVNSYQDSIEVLSNTIQYFKFNKSVCEMNQDYVSASFWFKKIEGLQKAIDELEKS